jgi:hypothetical protein
MLSHLAAMQPYVGWVGCKMLYNMECVLAANNFALLMPEQSPLRPCPPAGEKDRPSTPQLRHQPLITYSLCPAPLRQDDRQDLPCPLPPNSIATLAAVALSPTNRLHHI